MYLSEFLTKEFKYVIVENFVPTWATPFYSGTLEFKSVKLSEFNARWDKANQKLWVTINGNARRMKGYLTMKYGLDPSRMMWWIDMDQDGFVEFVLDMEQMHEYIYSKSKN